MKLKYPKGSVVVTVPRSELPGVFASPWDYNHDVYRQVEVWDFVIVPSRSVVRAARDRDDAVSYAFIYSGKSGRCYRWRDYFVNDYTTNHLTIEGPQMLVQCVPDKDHTKPPKSVNLYASTAGVVWLALRSLEPWVQNEVPTPLCELDDAPFSLYFDKLEELEKLGPHKKDSLRRKLELFFGVVSR